MRGAHCLHQWSRTQATISLSSGEAELNAALKGGAELLGARTLLQELGDDVELELRGDSSACSGTLHREGAGRIKHLELRQLWIQSLIKSGDLSYIKIPREENPSDSLAKPWTTEGHRHFAMASYRVCQDPCVSSEIGNIFSETSSKIRPPPSMQNSRGFWTSGDLCEHSYNLRYDSYGNAPARWGQRAAEGGCLYNCRSHKYRALARR